MKNNIILKAGLLTVIAVIGAFALSFFSQSFADGGGDWWTKKAPSLSPQPVKRIFGSSGNEYQTVIRPNAGASFNGASIEGYGQSFSASTTACSLISPVATSTMLDMNVIVTRNATSTTRIMYIATSTLAARYSTSTAADGISDASLIYQATIPPNAASAWHITATSTYQGSVLAVPNSSSSIAIYPPNTAVVVSFNGGGGDGRSPNSVTQDLFGSCSALWNRYQ